MSDLVAWVALSLLKHVGGKTFNALLSHFDGDTGALLQADTATLRTVPGVGVKIAAAIQQINLDRTAVAIQQWQNAGIKIITMQHPHYPAALKPLIDAPPTLFALGTLPLPQTENVAAIVGTRTPQPASLAHAHRLAATLARDHQALIVSGLALGIDSAAHQGALNGGGRTCAVLGSGFMNNTLYPMENRALARRILEADGVLLCEVAPDAPVSVAGLVARNRLITGIANRVMIIETAADGGAMHAARYAIAQGRAVYAAVNAASGNQALLAAGALPLS